MGGLRRSLSFEEFGLSGHALVRIHCQVLPLPHIHSTVGSTLGQLRCWYRTGSSPSCLPSFGSGARRPSWLSHGLDAGALADAVTTASATAASTNTLELAWPPVEAEEAEAAAMACATADLTSSLWTAASATASPAVALAVASAIAVAVTQAVLHAVALASAEAAPEPRGHGRRGAGRIGGVYMVSCSTSLTGS